MESESRNTNLGNITLIRPTSFISAFCIFEKKLMLNKIMIKSVDSLNEIDIKNPAYESCQQHFHHVKDVFEDFVSNKNPSEELLARDGRGNVISFQTVLDNFKLLVKFDDFIQKYYELRKKMEQYDNLNSLSLETTENENDSSNENGQTSSNSNLNNRNSRNVHNENENESEEESSEEEETRIEVRPSIMDVMLGFQHLFDSQVSKIKDICKELELCLKLKELLIQFQKEKEQEMENVQDH